MVFWPGPPAQGGEFLALADTVAEKLRLLIAQNRFEIDDLSLSITVSCGITQFLKGDGHETAFKRADQALYAAKRAGRNTVR